VPETGAREEAAAGEGPPLQTVDDRIAQCQELRERSFPLYRRLGFRETGGALEVDLRELRSPS